MGWPNSFRFCHLDKSLAWVRDVLEDWLGKNLNLPPFQGGKVGLFGFYGLGSPVRWRGIAHIYSKISFGCVGTVLFWGT